MLHVLIIQDQSYDKLRVNATGGVETETIT